MKNLNQEEFNHHFFSVFEHFSQSKQIRPNTLSINNTGKILLCLPHYKMEHIHKSNKQKAFVLFGADTWKLNNHS